METLPVRKKIREYAVFPVPPELAILRDSIQDYRILIDRIRVYLADRLRGVLEPGDIIGVPSLNWAPYTDELGHAPPPLDTLVVSLAVPADAVDEVHSVFRDVFNAEIGTDMAGYATEYWCPSSADQPLFGDRAAARRLINADALVANNLRGNGVNVVVVDHGLDRRWIPNYRGGWLHRNPYTGAVRLPGQTRGDDARHGLMIVRNILDAAPDAHIWDFPLIPPRIWAIDPFVSDAQVSYFHVLNWIKVLRHIPGFSGPWLMVNAWAIFDRRSEGIPGSYTNGLHHLFNEAISQTADAGLDQIFCAGNCGQFCPDPRCGPRDQGPGQSIFGANSHPRVISVGAVRTDARCLGYSSQGPGQPNLARHKPNICAPSGFAEAHDADTGNTGTSAACGVVAGVVAALRSKWGQTAISPDALRIILELTARQTEGAGWNRQLGHGIIDAGAAVNALKP